MQVVSISRNFDFPVDVLYRHLSDHNNLSSLFAPAKVTRIKEGDSSTNGIGSVRRIKIPLAPAFEETIIDASENQLISYRITRGSPLNHHNGEMQFRALDDNHCQLNYRIELGSAVPGLACLVKTLLTRSITQGLDKFQQQQSQLTA